jgi:acetyl esterase/lipase
MDPPRTEQAFAAALPLAGLDAWRIYLGLPMFGSRQPEGGFDEVMRLGNEDAVLKLYGPVADQVAAEFAPAWQQLRDELGLGGPVALVGGSFGAAAAMLALLESSVQVEAVVLISPLIRLRSVVSALGRRFNVRYPWGAESDAVARRLDFVARAQEIADRGAPHVLAVVGAEDEADGFLDPAAELVDALAQRYGATREARLEVVDGMAHALAEEPGIEPAPQTAHAARVDELVTRWLSPKLRERADLICQ